MSSIYGIDYSTLSGSVGVTGIDPWASPTAIEFIPCGDEAQQVIRRLSGVEIVVLVCKQTNGSTRYASFLIFMNNAGLRLRKFDEIIRLKYAYGRRERFLSENPEVFAVAYVKLRSILAPVVLCLVLEPSPSWRRGWAA